MWSLCAQYLWAVLWFSVHCQDSINVSVAMNFLFWWNMRLQRTAREGTQVWRYRSKALLATVKRTSDLEEELGCDLMKDWTMFNEHDMWIWFKEPVHYMHPLYILTSWNVIRPFPNQIYSLLTWLFIKCMKLWRSIAQDKFPPLIQIADCSKTTVVDFADRVSDCPLAAAIVASLSCQCCRQEAWV